MKRALIWMFFLGAAPAFSGQSNAYYYTCKFSGGSELEEFRLRSAEKSDRTVSFGDRKVQSTVILSPNGRAVLRLKEFGAAKPVQASLNIKGYATATTQKPPFEIEVRGALVNAPLYRLRCD